MKAAVMGQFGQALEVQDWTDPECRPRDVIIEVGACGNCDLCRADHQNVCANLQIPGFHFSGGFASHAKVANADVNVVKLPDAISFADAAGMGCRVVTVLSRAGGPGGGEGRGVGR